MKDHTGGAQPLESQRASASNSLRQRFYRRVFPYGASISLSEGLARGEDNFLLLRIVAASMVIYGHAATIAPAVSKPDFFVTLGFGSYSGEIAVNIFFLISGFLVTGSFLRHGSLLRFFKLRALRLIPGYIAVLVFLSIPVGLALTSLSAEQYLKSPDVMNYVSKNIRLSSDMAWTLPGVFEGAKTSTINGSQWTLPAEVRMYVLLGLFGALGLLASKRLALIALGCIGVVGLFYPYFLPLHADWFRLAGYFILGIAAFMYRENIRISTQLLAALIMLAVLTRHLPIYPQIFAIALAGAVFWVAYLLPTRVSIALERFGDPSYGIYLWGWPSQQLVAHVLPAAGLAVHVLLSLVLASILGYLSWHLIEKQALRMR